MNQEPPIDLQSLDPGEPPDLVEGAVRRFRIHVVLFTVLAIVGTAVLVTWGAVTVVHARNRAELREQTLWGEPQRTIMDLGAFNCETPTYSVGSVYVTLLQSAPMPGGGWALHFVVEGKDGPLTVERTEPDGSSFPRRTTLVPVGSTESLGTVYTQPGATWGETYVAVPASAGDRFGIEVHSSDSETAGTFTVDANAVSCEP